MGKKITSCKRKNQVVKKMIVIIIGGEKKEFKQKNRTKF